MSLPAKIGKYEIIEVIGRNLGIIYQARDSVSGRLVALKIMHPDAREHLLNEARLLGMLNHPNIVVAYETGEFDGDPYVALELLDGEMLDSIIRSGRALTLLQKIDIILQISEALQYVHDKGIVHRNVKPGNVMLLRDGKIKLVDFECACRLDDAITETPESGKIVGTLAYMSPEQLGGEPSDGRTDVFCLGATFYHLLEGELPFEGANMTEWATKILRDPPPRSKRADDLRLPELQAIFDKALAKEKRVRYQSCAEFSEDLMLLRRRLEFQTSGE